MDGWMDSERYVAMSRHRYISFTIARNAQRSAAIVEILFYSTTANFVMRRRSYSIGDAVEILSVTVTVTANIF